MIPPILKKSSDREQKRSPKPLHGVGHQPSTQNTKRLILNPNPQIVAPCREPLYAESSQYDFLCVSPQADLEDDHAQFLLLADRAVRNARVPITKGTVTISLTHSDMVLAAADAAAMERCADAFELRVDLLGSGRSFEDLRSQYTLLRRATSLPIIWTIRSKAQGGDKLRNSTKHSKPTQHHLLKRNPKFLGPDPKTLHPRCV